MARPFPLSSTWILLLGFTVALHSTISSASALDVRELFKRGDCRTQTVVSGDSCGSLASKCNISPSDFTKYNPDPNLCSTLQVGQKVCCSEGTVPKPVKNANGTCASYVVKKDESCSSIALANGLKPVDLATFNDKVTWGWSGCSTLGEKLKICLSEGSPPLPQAIDNAVCGPLKPGTKEPSSGTNLTSLNPCPLNACCNIWGQCGISPDFCTISPGPTGNPGTSPPGKFGCISNCGIEAANVKRPASNMHVGYYESWNFDRPCLNFRVDDLDKSRYTHYQWAFADVSPKDFTLSINDTFKQWNTFKAMTDIKKVVSIGGWAFSTLPNTYDTLRKAMTGNANSKTFAQNIVNFLNQHGLDGIDIDWEYPGAPDIPGIPPGLATDGINYLQFLINLRQIIPKGKTISIAAPASYWYLKNFPIKNMATYVDYIVYMTYDLHGQWDAGNQYVSDGCPKGNCLRSHVNATETSWSLAMITKAGVSTDKILVGISSYGRSFAMSQPSCTGPMCTFLGTNISSPATPGPCTGEPGYLGNAEIYQLLSESPGGGSLWYDDKTQSDIAVYGRGQWVAFMSDKTRSTRRANYMAYSYLGTADWAVDLLKFGQHDGEDPSSPEIEWASEGDFAEINCDRSFDSLETLDKDANNLEDYCKPQYTLQALMGELNKAVQSYNDIMANNYDKKFNTYSKAIASNADRSVQDLMTKNGSTYFNCIVIEATLCCDSCKGQNGNGAGDPCKGCFRNDDCYRTVGPIRRQDQLADSEWFSTSNPLSGGSLVTDLAARDVPGPPKTVLNVKYINASEPCPPDYSQRGYGPPDQSVYWSFKQDKVDSFYAGLLSTTGISREKTKIADRDRGAHCSQGQTRGDGDKCWNSGWDFETVVTSGYTAADVVNPKVTVEQALKNSNSIKTELESAFLAVKYSGYAEDALELVDAVILPVRMVVDAVQQMQTVEDVAEEIDEARKKAIIMAVFGALLFIIPIAGQTIGAAAGMAELAAFATAFGVVGEVAMGVYSVVSEKNNPLLGILQIILAPTGLQGLGAATKAANIRRSIPQTQLNKLGPKVTAGLAVLKKLYGVCGKR